MMREILPDIGQYDVTARRPSTRLAKSGTTLDGAALRRVGQLTQGVPSAGQKRRRQTAQGQQQAVPPAAGPLQGRDGREAPGPVGPVHRRA